MAQVEQQPESKRRDRARRGVNWAAVSAAAALLTAITGMVTAGAGIWHPPVPVPALKVTLVGPTTAPSPTRSIPVSPGPSSTSTGQAPPQLSLPAAYVGSWTGSIHVYYYSTDNALNVTLHGGQVGGVVGEYNYPTVKCQGMLALDRITDQSVMLTQQPTVSVGLFECYADRVEISLSGASMDWKTYWVNSPGGTPDGEGSLAKTG